MKVAMLSMAALCASGCGAFKKPTTFPEQATSALKTPANNGHLDADLQAVSGKEASTSVQSDGRLIYVSNSGRQICVQLETGAQHFPAHDTVESELAEYNSLAKQTRLVFAAHDSLDKVGAWPDSRDGATGTVINHHLTKKSHVDADGDTQDIYTLDVVLEWCGATPPLKASSKYLTVTRFYEAQTPALFTWIIDETPNLTPVVTPDEPAPEAQDPPSE
jgi:hypothetical protein